MKFKFKENKNTQIAKHDVNEKRVFARQKVRILNVKECSIIAGAKCLRTSGNEVVCISEKSLTHVCGYYIESEKIVQHKFFMRKILKQLVAVLF